MADELANRQLYTPAVLAELVGVPVRTIRRLQRAGFIEPVTEVMQLPHFDYRGLTTARQLANWLRDGVTVRSIEIQLSGLRERTGDSIPLDQLPITIEGGRLVLREGDQYFEASGQLRFGFDPPESCDTRPATVKFRSKPELAQAAVPDGNEPVLSLEAIVDEAIAAEDEGEFETAIRWYRCALTAHGPNADICFQLAEVLYRIGDSQGARERYFMALELNPDLLEARANLGCVLAECQQTDLAIAAFEGALEQFADYSDVHFHLARTLDAAGEASRATEHWQRFLDLSPASPWAEEAQARLNQHAPLLEF